jgi:hypothetical protein
VTGPQWGEVKRLFHEALDRPVDGRLFLIDVAARRMIDLLAIKGRWFSGIRPQRTPFTSLVPHRETAEPFSFTAAKRKRL